MTMTMTMTLRRSRPAVAAALALAASLALTACGSSEPATSGNGAVVSQEEDRSLYKGTEVDTAFAKPDLVFTDTEGKRFDLREQTAGRAVLLFFGYTNCPDVCPTTLGDLALALREQPKDVRDKTDVVFVSTDPDRDTPQVLKKWLASFDKDFIGLRGDVQQVKKAALSLGIEVEEPETHHDGSVHSSHGAQVPAFLPTDDKAHVLYTSNTPMKSFAHDLPLLAKGKQSTTPK